jgi:peptidoglycan lytic transglycosylase
MMPVLVLASALMMMTVAPDVSAKDGLPSGVSSTAPAAPEANAGTKPKPKTAFRVRRWLQVGLASWYGLQFQGRKTAAGERFDMNTMTCAHPSLPMGTWLRVTNLKNRRITFVRVNDRGPVVDGRIVDLSYAAARAVGLAGIGKVKLEAVGESDPDLDRALVAQVQMPVLFDALGR